MQIYPSIKFIEIWKNSLGNLLNFYKRKRGKISSFFPKLFCFFVLLNVGCYWLALMTAFPFLFYSSKVHYFKLQFPVGILGALFDSLSFFVTIFIIRRALRCQHGLEYVAHLFIDFLIAVLATFWVLFVFSFSGWIIEQFDPRPGKENVAPLVEISQTSQVKLPQTEKLTTKVKPKTTKSDSFEYSMLNNEKPETLKGRNKAYHEMLGDALANPLANFRYIYFGLIMGISASLPTCLHIYMFVISLWKSYFRKKS